VLAAVCAASVGSASAAEYPAWPMENEKVDIIPIDILPEATPSFKFDEEDPGGYTRYAYTCQFKQPFVSGESNVFDSCQPMLKQSEEWRNPNCSQSKTTFELLKEEGKDVYDIVGHKMQLDGTFSKTETYCNKGECCEYFNKKEAGVMFAFDYPGAMKRMDYAINIFKTKKCSTGNWYPSMCMRLFVNNLWCMQNFLAPNKRHIIYPCPDAWLTWRLSCKLLVASTVNQAEAYFEPITYMSKVSTRIWEQMQAVAYAPDRVCTPLSYWYPAEYGKSAATSAAAASTSAAAASTSAAVTSSSTSPSTVTSQASLVQMTVVMLVGLMFVAFM